MARVNYVNGDMHVDGSLTATSITPSGSTITNSHIASTAAIERTKLAQDTVQKYGIDATMFRVWDNFASLLPTSAASDDLGIAEGTFGTDYPTIQTSDAKATTVTQRGRFLFTIPPEYDSAQTFEIHIFANMITTVSDGTATVDVECYEGTAAGAVGSDICATAAQSINSLTNAEKTFTITATDLVPGDQLDVRVTIAITDAATATAVIGEITRVYVQMDIKG